MAWHVDVRRVLQQEIIIGAAWVTADDEPLGQQQMHGDIVVADEKRGIGVRGAGTGEMYWLAPDLRQVALLGDGRR
jgi:hypothetical protein